MQILATLCYVMKDEQTLMLHRVKKKNDHHLGKWNGLGGKFEEGETPEECVVREVEEESGLKIEDPHLCGFIVFPKFDGKNDWNVFLFRAEKFSGELNKNSAEGNLEWKPNKKLFELNLWEGDKIFLKWIFEKKFFSAKFIYKNKKFVDYKVVFHK